MARYSISGNKKKTLADRQKLFTGEPDKNLMQPMSSETCFRGYGSLSMDYGTISKEEYDSDKYMDLK